MIQLVFLVATAKLVTMTKYWPAFAVVYAIVVYAMTRWWRQEWRWQFT